LVLSYKDLMPGLKPTTILQQTHNRALSLTTRTISDYLASYFKESNVTVFRCSWYFDNLSQFYFHFVSSKFCALLNQSRPWIAGFLPGRMGGLWGTAMP